MDLITIKNYPMYLGLKVRILILILEVVYVAYHWIELLESVEG